MSGRRHGGIWELRGSSWGSWGSRVFSTGLGPAQTNKRREPRSSRVSALAISGRRHCENLGTPWFPPFFLVCAKTNARECCRCVFVLCVVGSLRDSGGLGSAPRV
eukprot:8096630-Pyramimonas_sp.AAC.1